jgi:hypothetical protein
VQVFKEQIGLRALHQQQLGALAYHRTLRGVLQPALVAAVDQATTQVLITLRGEQAVVVAEQVQELSTLVLVAEDRAALALPV